ncbi:MAG: carbohydrate ABC transporter permease [Chloroflexota bacterium]|nr:carbohydrate ABC transporter permease [Chloroflexota bacterium]
MFRRVTRNPMVSTLLFVVLVAAALVNLVPFLWMISTSLKPLSKVFAYPPEWIPNPIKWSNYPNALHVINPRVFLNSVIVTCSIVLIQGLVTTMGGFAFARLRFPFRDQIFLLYLGTILIPSQVTLIPSYIVIVHLGWVDTYQGIIAPVVAHGAFGTFLFRQFFLRIPDEYYEAARLDGANYWQQFWRLTLPLSRPVLSAYGILTFLNAWKLYLWPLIVIRSPQMKVLPMAIAELSGTAGEDRAVMMAAVALSILPLLVLWIVAQKWIIQGIASSGLKG